MPRQVLQFTRPQLAFLRQEAGRLGLTVAELVRRIIDEHRLRPARQEVPDA